MHIRTLGERGDIIGNSVQSGELLLILHQLELFLDLFLGFIAQIRFGRRSGGATGRGCRWRRSASRAVGATGAAGGGMAAAGGVRPWREAPVEHYERNYDEIKAHPTPPSAVIIPRDTRR